MKKALTCFEHNGEITKGVASTTRRHRSIRTACPRQCPGPTAGTGQIYKHFNDNTHNVRLSVINFM